MSVPTAPFEVVKVVDTRDFLEVDDRFVPVSGSGDVRVCDRCDRTHEVHAHVVDANGLSFTVGTGCMDATKNEASSAARRATTVARNAARRAAAETLAAGLADAEAAVAAMAFPADRVERSIEETASGVTFHRWEVDGAFAKIIGGGRDVDARTVAERLRCVEDNWRRDRLHELMPRETVNKARREADWAERNPS